MTAERVLVTGAFGLVGSAVVGALADQDRRVVATDLACPRIANARRRSPPTRGWRCAGGT
jgi:nucleoside-diphosphate-sugar epimerase